MHEALGDGAARAGPRRGRAAHARSAAPAGCSGCLSRAAQIEVTASAGRERAQPAAGDRARRCRRRDDRSPTYGRPRPAAPAAAAASPQPRPGDCPTRCKGRLPTCRRWSRNSAGARRAAARSDLPEALFHLFTDLIDADVSEELARELVERVRREVRGGELADPLLLQGPHRADDRSRDPRRRPDRRHARPAPRWWPWSARPAWARPRPSPSWPPTTG